MSFGALCLACCIIPGEISTPVTKYPLAERNLAIAPLPQPKSRIFDLSETVSAKTEVNQLRRSSTSEQFL